MIEPYIGLRSFGPEHVRLFFGRERVVENLLSTLAQARFIAVIGASGVGKSSVVRAGLRPSLEAGYLDWKGGEWDVVEFRPGSDPISRLAEALAESDWSKSAASGETKEARTLGWKKLLSDTPLGLQRAIAALPRKRGERLLIIVDQFEETFRLPQSAATTEDERARKDALNARRVQSRAFIDLLLAAANSGAPVYVVVTMRSEFLGECAEHPPLAEAVNRGLFLVSNMTEGELRDAISMPALLAKNPIDPALADALIEETRGEQFQLPMLQHFLMQAWQDGNGKIETDKWLRRQEEKSAKEKTKLKQTPADVLDADLNAALSALAPEQKILAQRLFKRITTRRDGKDTRDPARLKQIAAFAETTPQELEVVIDHFRKKGRCFLEPLTGELRPETPIDITHEAIIFSWSELKRWIGEEAEQARALEDLWRKSQSGKAMTREEMDEGRRLLKLPAWAERYASLYQRLYGGELKSVREFLDDRMADAESLDLQAAFQSGRVNDIESLVFDPQRQVRLIPAQLDDFRFKAHYYALLPDELSRGDDRSSASSPEDTEAVLSKRRQDRIKQIFTPEVCRRKTDRGQSVAHFAASGGSLEIIDHLKAIGAELNDENEQGNTPFFWAVNDSKLDVAKRLVEILSAPQTIGKISNISGRTALHSAAEKANASVLDWLLREGGASANVADKYGNTPLHHAASYANASAVEALAGAMQNVDPTNKRGRTPLINAAGQRDLAGVNALLAKGANAAHAADDGMTALIALFAQTPDHADRKSASRAPILDALLATPAGPSSLPFRHIGANVLHHALEAADPADEIDSVIEKLVDRGAPVTLANWSGVTPVEMALRRGLTNAALLMAQRADSDADAWPDWFVAAIEADNEAAVYGLLDINSSTTDRLGRHGRAPLHAAAAATEPWMLYALLNENPNLEVRNRDGETPLRLAMRHGKADAVRALLAEGAEEPTLVKFHDEKLAVVPTEVLSAHLQKTLAAEAHWPFGMILTGAWRDCASDEALQRLLPLYKNVAFALSTPAENIRAVRTLPLKSIADAELCQALVADGENASYYSFLIIGGTHVVLDDDFNWFAYVRQVDKLRLSDRTAVAEFVCLTYASWQRGGISMVLEDTSRAFLAGGPEDPTAHAKVVEAIAATPFHVSETATDGTWRGACVFKYQRKIVKAEFSVRSQDGGIRHTLTEMTPRLSVSSENLERGLYSSRAWTA